MGGNAYIDLLWNHSGFKDNSTTGFSASGGYPGFAVTLQNTNPANPGYNTLGYNDVDGDYHAANATGDTSMRISGLDDIAQEKNYRFIRQPTVAGPNNIPAGTTPLNGRLANQPDVNNAQYYPDTSQPALTLSAPAIGPTAIQRYSFNLASPMSGDPVQENALDYLMRYTQWMVQVMGADGFRVDAAKNMPASIFNNLRPGGLSLVEPHAAQRAAAEHLLLLRSVRRQFQRHSAVRAEEHQPRHAEHGGRQSRCARLPALLRARQQPEQQRRSARGRTTGATSSTPAWMWPTTESTTAARV